MAEAESGRVAFTIIDKVKTNSDKIDITITTSDRIAIFGRTGSGKTYFSTNYLLPHYNSYVFWDVKEETRPEEIKASIVVDGPDELKKEITEHKKILYQPSDPTDADFNAVCEIIFNKKNIALYVDEAAAVTMPGRIQYWHKMIITQGRSRGVGIINVSQRPRDIHNTLISESEHIFIFTLSLETDILKLRQQIGDAADEIRYLPEHHFLYYSVQTGKSFIFKPVRKLEDIEKPRKSSIFTFKSEDTGKPHKLERYIPKLDDYIKLREQRET